MKKIIYAIPFFIIGICAISCNKNTQTVTENPLNSAITNGKIDSITTRNGGSFEFGNKLYFSKNGSVTKLGCKMPSTGDIQVSFWDAYTGGLLARASVTITDPAQFNYTSISPVSVKANTRYVLSLNNTSGGASIPYYVGNKKSGSGTIEDLIYPFTSGSVTYEQPYYASSPTSVYPSFIDVNKNYIGGFSDLQFEFEVHTK